MPRECERIVSKFYRIFCALHKPVLPRFDMKRRMLTALKSTLVHKLIFVTMVHYYNNIYSRPTTPADNVQMLRTEVSSVYIGLRSMTGNR